MAIINRRLHKIQDTLSVLNPLSFNAEIARHLPNFTGRKWLLEKHKQWLESDLNSRVFRIEGGPGLGKTAIASRLAHTIKSSVVAIFLCQYNSTESRNPLRFIQTLAYQLSTRLPDYRSRLLLKLSNNTSREIQDKSPADLWASLIAEPLHRLNDRQRLTILIDGLDEATDHGQNEIVKLLAEHIDKLPHWLTVTLTGRPDPELVQRLSRYKPYTINGNDANNQSDLEAYIAHWLQKEVSANKISATQAEGAKKSLLEKSEGAFLYLAKAREAYEAGYLDLTQPSSLPVGLNEIYMRFFERRFADTSENSDWAERVSPLLRYILLSPEPLPLNIARELMGWTIADDGDEKQAATLRNLGSLIELRDSQSGTILSLFHNSVREWLQNSQLANHYFIGFRLSYLTKLCTLVWENYIKDHDRYGWLLLPEILPLLKEKSETSLNNFFSDLISCYELSKISETLLLAQRLNAAQSMFQITIEYSARLSKSSKNLSEIKMLTGSISSMYAKLSKIDELLGNKKKSLQNHSASLQILENLYNHYPEDDNIGKCLSSSYQKYGRIQLSLNNTMAAKQYYKLAHKIAKAQYKRFSKSSYYRYLLSISYNELGDMEEALCNIKRARCYYKLCLGIVENLPQRLKEKSENISDISKIYSSLGHIELKLGNMLAALSHYTKSFSVLSNADPTNTRHARSLYCSYSNLGMLEVSIGRPELAKDFFQKSIEIARNLNKIYPENTIYSRDLAILYYRTAITSELVNENFPIKATKKPSPVNVNFAIKLGKLETLEGTVSYDAGAAILTGQSGDTWPVERAKFDASYEAMNGTNHGEDGTYQKRPIEVLAIKLTEPTSVKVGYANDTITGRVGDWLVQYGESDFGIVSAEIFAKTYEILGPESKD